MRYYLRTLEGVGRCLGATFDEFKARIDYRRQSLGQGVRDAVRDELTELYYNGDNSYIGIVNQVKATYGPGTAAALGVMDFENLLEAEAARAAIDARRAAEAQAKAQAEAEAARAAIDARRAAEAQAKAQAEAEARAMIEQANAEAQAEAAVIEEAQQIINEVATMEQEETQTATVEISPVSVHAEHEYTIIDEDANTITYQDETGAVHVEPKAGGALPWLIAGAVALFLIV